MNVLFLFSILFFLIVYFFYIYLKIRNEISIIRDITNFKKLILVEIETIQDESVKKEVLEYILEQLHLNSFDPKKINKLSDEIYRKWGIFIPKYIQVKRENIIKNLGF